MHAWMHLDEQVLGQAPVTGFLDVEDDLEE
jgi:hypothetical protein